MRMFPPHYRLVTALAAIGADPADPEDLRLQKSLLVLSCSMIATLAAIWSIVYFELGYYLPAAIPLGYSLCSFGSLGWYAHTRRYGFFRFSQLLLTLLLPFALMLVMGGFVNSSAVIVWSLASPLGAMLFAGRRQSAGWFAAYLVLLLAGGLLGPWIMISRDLPTQVISAFFVANIAFVSIVMFALLQYSLGQRDTNLALLRTEQAKSERLLLNILPAPIAGRLKNDEKVIADRFAQASILFADMVGFTPLTARMDAQAMVDLLNEVFSRFDDFVEKYDLEKIRTIGDSYMVASGVPIPRPDHAQALARMALDIQAYIEHDPHCAQSNVRFRIGISSGPVVAGVIGRRKFIYDVWGDTVNTASRMESHGLPGRIHISPPTYQLLKDEFDCTARGTVMVKGKGAMDTWFLLGARQQATA